MAITAYPRGDSEIASSITTVSSFPASPLEGDCVYRTDENKFYLYTGTEWEVQPREHGIEAHIGAVAATSQINMPIADTPTYTDLEDLVNSIQSSGLISGAAVTTNVDFTVNVAAGTGIAKGTDSDIGQSIFVDTPAAPNISIPSGSTSYFYGDYNAGAPLVSYTGTLANINDTTQFHIADVWRDDDHIDIYEGGTSIHDLAQRIQEKGIQRGLERVSGMILGETGTRNITVTAGKIYLGLNQKDIDATDTSGADVLETFYRDGSGGWVEVGNQTQLDNEQYDDDSGSLATLTAQRYAVHWVYQCYDTGVYVLYGRGDYTLANAIDAPIPSTIPPRFAATCILIGKVIVQKSASSFTDVLSTFTAELTPSGVTDHSDLSNLQGGTASEYYHLTSAQEADLTDAGDSSLHYHSTDRDRTNHTGTQLKATISDFVHGEDHWKDGSDSINVASLDSGAAAFNKVPSAQGDGTIEWTNQTGDITTSRSALVGHAIDFTIDSDEYKYQTITSATEYTCVNPVLGKMISVEIDGNYAVTLPATVNVVNGDYCPGLGTNHLYLLCNDAVTPAYQASWTVVV